MSFELRRFPKGKFQVKKNLWRLAIRAQLATCYGCGWETGMR